MIVNFAAESHNSLAILDPTRFFQTNVMGTQALAEAARRHGVARFHHISTCEVYGDLPLDSDEVVHRGDPLPAPDPVQRLEGRWRPRRAGLRRDLRAAGHHHQLLQQLRARTSSPRRSSRCSPPGRSTTRRCRSTSRPRTSGSGSTSTTTAGPSSWCSQHGVVGETYNVGSGVEASIEEIADAVLAATGRPQSLKEIVPDRPSHDRRYLLDSTQDPDGSWAGSRRSPSRRVWPTPWLVRRQPQLVGAAARPGPGGRGRLERSRRRRTDAVTGERARRGCWSPAGTASSDGMSGTCWPGRSRAGGVAESLAGRIAAAAGRARAPSRCCRPTSTPLDLVDRDAVRDAVDGFRPDLVLHGGRLHGGRRLRVRSRHGLRRELDGHAPRGRGRRLRGRPPRLRVHRLRVRRHLARSVRRVGPARPRARSTGAASSAGEQEVRAICGAAGDHRADRLGQRRPRRQHGEDRPAAGRAPRRTRPSGSSTTSTAAPRSPPTWPGPSSGSAPTGARARST